MLGQTRTQHKGVFEVLHPAHYFVLVIQILYFVYFSISISYGTVTIALYLGCTNMI
jgi:hypothetical protein